MTSPLLEKVRAALATVNDPEIKRPITDLKMVEGLAIDDTGRVTLTVLLTVSGCPMKDTITRDVNAAVRAVPGVTDVDLTLGVMTTEQRGELQETLRGGQAQREIPFAQAASLTKVYAIASGKGGVGKSSVTVNLAAVDGQAGDEGRHRRRRHLRTLGARDARRGRHPADAGRGPDHAGAHRERRLRDQHRHAQAEARAGRRLARADARPGARADAVRRLLGRPRRPASSTCRPAPATSRSRSASTCRTPRSWW